MWSVFPYKERIDIRTRSRPHCWQDDSSVVSINIVARLRIQAGKGAGEHAGGDVSGVGAGAGPLLNGRRS